MCIYTHITHSPPRNSFLYDEMLSGATSFFIMTKIVRLSALGKTRTKNIVYMYIYTYICIYTLKPSNINIVCIYIYIYNRYMVRKGFRGTKQTNLLRKKKINRHSIVPHHAERRESPSDC